MERVGVKFPHMALLQDKEEMMIQFNEGFKGHEHYYEKLAESKTVKEMIMDLLEWEKIDLLDHWDFDVAAAWIDWKKHRDEGL